MFNIFDNLVTNAIITEGRIERIKTKYVQSGKISNGDFEKLSALDTTPTLKYLEWLVKVYIKDRNIEQLQVITDFNALVDKQMIKGEQSDINGYKNAEQVYDVVKHFEDKQSKSSQIKDIRINQTERVFENDEVVVVAPKTKESSCKYGAGTKWCTAASFSNNYFNSYYFGTTTLYYVIKKQETGDALDKVAVAVSDNGAKTYYDAEDRTITAAVANAHFKSLGINF